MDFYVLGHVAVPRLYRRLVFVRHVLGDSLGLCAFLYVMLKFAVKREQRQVCLNFAEREQIEQS